MTCHVPSNAAINLARSRGISARRERGVVAGTLPFGLWRVRVFMADLPTASESTGICDAARYIAHSRNPNDPTIKKDAKYLATTGAIDGDTPRVSGWTPDDVEISYSLTTNLTNEDGLPNFRGGNVIESVTVSTTFTVPSLGFFGMLGLTAPTFSI